MELKILKKRRRKWNQDQRNETVTVRMVFYGGES